jgi:hypothetical protein
VNILVIRSARDVVFRQYLATATPQSVTALAQPGSMPNGVCLVPAPAGPMQWRRLPEPQQATLTSTDWDEVVILHNLGDDSYDEVIGIALRSAPFAPLTIHYADGVQRRYRCTMAFYAGRKLMAAVGSFVFGLLMLVALGRRAR